ncbi:RraA-like protein [Tricholoma matsutake]|nr:RraA-like protein [Tricholoma matsutake 945]
MSSSELGMFSTCEISDALIKLGVPHGGHIPDIHYVPPLSSNGRICGPAYTVRIVLTSDKDAPRLSTHFVDTAPAGSIIVIDAPSQAKNAVWGGLMTAGAQARSVNGVVISGRCRDLAELRALQFPVFARGTSTLGQSSFTRASEINTTLLIKPHGDAGTFAAVTVKPGDWIVADEDGVVCVAHEVESQVIKLATEGRRVDELCMTDIRAGKGIQSAFEAHRGR